MWGCGGGGGVWFFFFFNDTATTEIYTLSLHDALPILLAEHLAVHDVLLSRPVDWVLPVTHVSEIVHLDGFQLDLRPAGSQLSSQQTSTSLHEMRGK